MPNLISTAHSHQAKSRSRKRHWADQEAEDEFRLATLAPKVQSVFSLGGTMWPTAVKYAIDGGERDPDKLTNLVFFMHYPERVRGGIGRSLSPTDPDFKSMSNTWRGMREMVQQALAAHATGPHTPPGIPTADGSRVGAIAALIAAERERFGLSKANEKLAANLWGNDRLRVISATSIDAALKPLLSFGAHVRYTKALFENAGLQGSPSGRDISFVLTMATREGGTRGVVRTDSVKVSSAGKDTHGAGVSGLDYLYARSRYFRNAGVAIEPVPKSALKPGRKDRKPAYIAARHLLLAHMIEVAFREKNIWNVHLRKAMKSNGLSGDPLTHLAALTPAARRAWAALSYSGNGYVRSLLRFFLEDAQRRGRGVDFNAILNHRLQGLAQKHKARVMLARATALRAHVFDRYLPFKGA